MCVTDKIVLSCFICQKSLVLHVKENDTISSH